VLAVEVGENPVATSQHCPSLLFRSELAPPAAQAAPALGQRRPAASRRRAGRPASQPTGGGFPSRGASSKRLCRRTVEILVEIIVDLGIGALTQPGSGLEPSVSVRIDALAGSAKRKQGPGLIASQSEIKNVKVVPHVSAVCRSGER